jgi:hypothetical protein
VIVKYTYFGDTNIDGVVNGVDLANFLEGYSLGLTGWRNGDFNYDGVVDVTDYNKLAAVLGATGLTNYGNGQALGGDTGAVPEPTGLLAGLLVAPLLTRRRR